jgi:hypothetical protein
VLDNGASVVNYSGVSRTDLFNKVLTGMVVTVFMMVHSIGLYVKGRL